MTPQLVHELSRTCPETVTIDRLVHLYHGLSQVLHFEVVGDICEFGCYRGVTSIFLASIIKDIDPGRTLRIYDSFAGLPEAGAWDGYVPAGSFVASLASVLAKFKSYNLSLPEVHAGWFSDTLAKPDPRPIAFAYIDTDREEGTWTVLNRIYRSLSPRGIIVVDDYCDPSKYQHCWDGLPGIRMAVDRFFSDKPEHVEVLPGHEALSLAMIRRCGG